MTISQLVIHLSRFKLAMNKIELTIIRTETRVTLTDSLLDGQRCSIKVKVG